MRYSEKFKAQMVRRMLPPRETSAVALAKLVGVSQPTLSRWLRDSLELMSEEKPPPSRPAVPPAQWPLKDRMRVVLRAEGLDDASLGALLREEGITTADLDAWRKLGSATDVGTVTSAADRKRIRELEKDLKRKDQALAETAAMLVFEKKLKILFGTTASSADEGGSTEPKNEE